MIAKICRDAIANGVTERIVDRFEMIEIDEKDGDRPRIGIKTARHRHAAFEEGATIGDAGQ